jgi:hypothetical protein
MLCRLNLERLSLELTVRQVGHECSIEDRVIRRVYRQVDVPVLVEVLEPQRFCVGDRELELGVERKTCGGSHGESKFVRGAKCLIL